MTVAGHPKILVNATNAYNMNKRKLFSNMSEYFFTLTGIRVEGAGGGSLKDVNE